MKKPRLISPCVADRYAGPGERIAEFSFPEAASGGGDLPGGLISLRYGRGERRPMIYVHRVEGCDVAAPESSEARQVAAIQKLFATWAGWREWDADYDPNDLLAEIANVVGEPLNTQAGA